MKYIELILSKRILKRFILLVLISLPFCHPIFTESDFAGYPIFGYENETGFYGGGLVYMRNRPKHFDVSVPPNSYYLSLEYSEKKQFLIKFEPKIHLKNGLYTLSSTINFKKWPSKFYGIGNNSLVLSHASSGVLHRQDLDYCCAPKQGLGNENTLDITLIDIAEDFTPNEFGCTFDVKRKLPKNWAISLIYNFSHYEITKMAKDGMLISGEIPGSKGGFNSGLGLQISYDSRNADSYTTKGELLSFRSMNYNKVIGSDYNFGEYTLDLRKYLSFSDKHVLALQGYISLTSNNPPFYSMPHLDKHMRGMTPNLHIDKQIAVLRAEYRFFPWEKGFLQRMGFVVFAENGQVADEPKSFSIANARSDFGFGLRYSFFMEDRLNLRIDIGFGEEDWNFSISTGEAF